MRLNGGAFNAQVVHGSRRAPIYASAVAAAGFFAEGDGQVEVHGQGTAAVLLGGSLVASALRPVVGQAIQIDLQVLGTGVRRRVGVGTVDALSLHTDPLGYQVWRRGAGAAPLIVDATLQPRAFRGLDANSLIRLRVEMEFSARRFAPLRAELRTVAEIAPTVYRVGATRRGFGGFSLLASLYYSRTQYGNGSASVILLARADVGVEFLDGAGTLHPMVAELAPNRRRWTGGSAPIRVGGSLAPSAVRRLAAAPLFDLRTHGALDPAHITADGVRYITPDLRALVSVHPADGGMQRRLTPGAFHPAGVQVAASGVLRRGRTAPVSRASASLLAHADFLSTRPFPDSFAVLGFGAQGRGDVFVRGEGAAPIRLVSDLYGRSARYIEGKAPLVVVAPDLNPLIYRGGRGAVSPISIQVALEPTRRRVGVGSLHLPTLLQEGGAVMYRGASGVWALGLQAEGFGDILVYGAGLGTVGVHAQGTGQVARFVEGQGDLVTEAQGYGDVFVRGAGRAISALGADLGLVRTQFLEADALLFEIDTPGEWVVPVREHLGEMLTTLGLELERVRWSRDLPALVKTFDAQGFGMRRAALRADAEIEVIGSSDAYINIGGEDTDVQTFIRPAELRAFVRASDERTFLRTL